MGPQGTSPRSFNGTWRHAVDSGLAAVVAFVDFKKAFDWVNHAILLNKLQCSFGILGPLFFYIYFYFLVQMNYCRDCGTFFA